MYIVDELKFGKLPLLSSPKGVPKRGEGARGKRKMRAGGFVSQLLNSRLVHASLVREYKRNLCEGKLNPRIY